MITVDAALLRTLKLPAHEGEVDKDDRGRVLVVGGSIEVPGGVLLAGLAALRAGAGKLQIATCRSVAPLLALKIPEALVTGLAETTDGGIDAAAAADIAGRLDRCDALLVGPGMVDADATARLALQLIGSAGDVQLVLDAAALADLGRSAEPLRRRRTPAVLTPHAGEMATLLDISRDAVRDDPEAAVRAAATRFGSVVVLKGSCTLVAAPDGGLYRYEGGGVGLATSGSGDTLAGIVAGLLARGAEPPIAAIWGVYLHGEAGCRLALRIGRIGYLARELLVEVPGLMGELDGSRATTARPAG